MPDNQTTGSQMAFTYSQSVFRKLIKPMPDQIATKLLDRYGDTPHPPTSIETVLETYRRNFLGMGIRYDKGGFASRDEYISLCQESVAEYRQLIEIFGEQPGFQLDTFDGYLEEK